MQKNGQSIETGNIYGTQDEEKHNTICVRHHHMHTHTNKANKTWYLLLAKILFCYT